MPERVTRRPLCHAGPRDCLLHRTLDDRLIQMMPALRTGLPVDLLALLREDPLPAPLRRSIRVFARQSIWHLDAAVSVRQVLLMHDYHAPEVLTQRLFGTLRQHGDPILAALAVKAR